jgi:hypothetical protein
MIPTLVPALVQHGRLQLGEGERAQLLAMSAATIDRMLGDVKGCGGGRPSPASRLLLRDPPRGADPNVQRLEGPGARLLRGRHGGAWRHVGGGLVHPDSTHAPTSG